MNDSKKKKQVTTAHRKARKTSVQSRKNLKRPNGKVLTENKKKTEKNLEKKPVKKVPKKTTKAKNQKRTVKVASEVSVSRRIRVRAEQYKEPKVEKLLPEPPKPKTETIKVRKAEPEQTPEEHLEEQAEFWSSLPAQPTIVKVPTPKPVDMNRVNERMRARTTIPAEPPKIPAKELKQQAIDKALRSTERKVTTPTTPKAQRKAKKTQQMRPDRVRFTWGRIMLALTCTVAAVFAIVYFVNLSAPDVSLKVAAMQSGIEATYPSFTPRDYSLSDITSEEGKITLTFRGNDGNSSYTLTEERSSWDSNALISNYVRPTYGEDYTAVREQGLTLYITDKGACWVNGGLLYKLKINTGTLTKKQIKTIATSL